MRTVEGREGREGARRAGRLLALCTATSLLIARLAHDSRSSRPLRPIRPTPSASPPRPLHPIPPAVLRHVQRRVRLGRQQLRGLPGFRTGGHAEGRASGQGRPFQSHGVVPSLIRIRSAIRPPTSRSGLGQPDRELLAPDAAGDVAAADLALDDAGEVDQRGVAGRDGPGCR